MAYKKKSGLRKVADKAARKVTNAIGAKNLARYAGETIARRTNKNVTRTVTGKQALKSAATTVKNIAPVPALGVSGRMIKLAKATHKANKVRKVEKAKKVAAAKAKDRSERAYLKRTYSGHENYARQQARKRINQRKKKK